MNILDWIAAIAVITAILLYVWSMLFDNENGDK